MPLICPNSLAVIWPAARDVEDAMGLDVLDELTASLDDVKQMDGM